MVSDGNAGPAAESGLAGAPGGKGSGTARRLSRFAGRRSIGVAAAAVLLAAAGAVWIILPPSSESTDNAYVEADATNVAPKVRGLVSAVLVRDNQRVRRGEQLVRIDPAEFDSRVQVARAELADAEADVTGARTALLSLGAQEQLDRANIDAARTDIRSSGAEADRARSDRRRFDALAATGAVALRDTETYGTAAVLAEHSAAKARARLIVSQREAGVTSAQGPELEAAIAKAQARRLKAKAALDLALQDQRNSLIRAAVDGVVGNRQVQVGDYVQPGTRLLTLVPMRQLYVTANFKETQTRRMRVGQRVEIEVDALGAALEGRIESIAPGSGSTFSLLPFEPGTGNFTKIVQRVPVRIRFEGGQNLAGALRPGLSVTAKVRLSD